MKRDSETLARLEAEAREALNNRLDAAAAGDTSDVFATNTNSRLKLSLVLAVGGPEEHIDLELDRHGRYKGGVFRRKTWGWSSTVQLPLTLEHAIQLLRGAKYADSGKHIYPDINSEWRFFVDSGAHQIHSITQGGWVPAPHQSSHGANIAIVASEPQSPLRLLAIIPYDPAIQTVECPDGSSVIFADEDLINAGAIAALPKLIGALEKCTTRLALLGAAYTDAYQAAIDALNAAKTTPDAMRRRLGFRRAHAEEAAPLPTEGTVRKGKSP
jgi:hypothetical protein